MGTANATDEAVIPRHGGTSPGSLPFLRLVEKDAWVGTEERLLDELKASAVEGGYRSSDSPHTLDELHTYIASACGSSTSWTSMFWTTATYLVIPKVLARGSDLPAGRLRVGPGGTYARLPALLVPAGEYYWALGKPGPEALGSFHPQPAALHRERRDDFGPAGRWIGPSFVLVRILCRHYPTFENALRTRGT